MHHPLLFSWTGQPTEMPKLRWPGMAWGRLSGVPLLLEASTAMVCLLLSFLSLLRACPSSQSVPRLRLPSLRCLPCGMNSTMLLTCSELDSAWTLRGRRPGSTVSDNPTHQIPPTTASLPTCCYSMYGIVNICVNPTVLGQLPESEAVKVSRSQKGNNPKMKSNHS